jgi:hypothetical protein
LTLAPPAGYDHGMITRKMVNLLLAGVVAAALAGCKKKVEEPPDDPTARWGPATKNVQAEPQKSPHRARVITAQNRWAVPKYDAGAKPDAPRPKPKGKGKTIAVATDADIAKYREEKARAETEKAVNTTLSAALPRMKPCFDRHGAASGDVVVRVRVHRSGYVMSSSVSGVSGEVQSCLDGVLRSLKVSNVQTDSISVERVFKFSSGR